MSNGLRETLTTSLARILRPIAKLVLTTGFGWKEFLNVARDVFVEVASEEYGIRGRPTNISRVAAMTGLSRKEIRRIRDQPLLTRWTPAMQASPANVVIHYWHHDPEFSHEPGKPKTLPYQGEGSFTELVKKYAGDIPPGAMRAELCRTDTVSEAEDKTLRVEKHFLHPPNLHDDFLHGIAFSWSHLGNTLVHNLEAARLRESRSEGNDPGRIERVAWTERFDKDTAAVFRQWVRKEASVFVEQVDHWIGRNEVPFSKWDDESRKAIGVGVYFFEEE